MTMAGVSGTSPLALAWQHTELFWAQTWSVVERHPLAVLLCAAVPAALRGYILLRRPSVPRTRLALLELIVTLWRVLLLAVAIWAACSGREWRNLRTHVSAAAAWQIALSRLGWHLAHHLRMVLWQLLIFALGFAILYTLALWILKKLARKEPWLLDPRHQGAVESLLRNLVFVPLGIIYLVEMARPAFQ